MKEGTVLVFVTMDGSEDKVEVLVQGLDLRRANFRTALSSYLERNEISLCCEPTVRQDGLVLLEIRSNEWQSGK